MGMESQTDFPRVSWGLCRNRIVPMGPFGYPRCNNAESGPLYDGECWDCRYLFAPVNEARLWADPEYWKTIDALPEPLPRTTVRVLYGRLRDLALGATVLHNDEARRVATDAARKLAAYGRQHYPENTVQAGDETAGSEKPQNTP